MTKVQVDSNGKVIILGGKALVASNGSGGSGEFLVQVIDYDGTVLKQEHLDTGATFTLPNSQTHEGLVFEGWSSPVTITNNTVTVTNSDITIGATYTTASGLSEFDITLTEVTGLSVTLNMNGTKDWGDGTLDTSMTHTYASVGDYTITCNGSTMTTSNSSGLFGQTGDSNNKNYYVRDIRLGSSVTSIGNNAFENCSSLTSITIPEVVTSISSSAFSNCHSLTSITIPEGVTSIGQSAFYNCYSLTSITIPEGVTSIGNKAFYACLSLTSITIPEVVTSIGSAAFSGCYSLTSITIPEGVTSIGSDTFGACYSLTNIAIPSSVTNMDYRAFSNCRSLTSITIPEGVTSISSYTFENCYSLTNIAIPSSVTNIDSQAFYNCDSIPEYDFSKHTTIPTLSDTDAFYGINKICKIYVPWDLYENWKSATNWSAYTDYLTNKNPATLNFTISPSGNSIVYVNSKQIQGTSTSWIGPSASYVVHDTINNVVLPGTQTGITEGSTVDITADLTISNKITLSTGVTGLTATATVYGVEFSMVEESSGNYVIKVAGSGTTIDYFINGDSNHMGKSGTITTTGSDITESITLTPAIDATWTRPNLTTDGTLGGSSFAVKDVEAGTSTSSYAWRAVDKSTATYWRGDYPSSGGKTYIFYNPDALRVTEIVYNYYSYTYSASAIVIQGSNDNSNWEDITSTYSGSDVTSTSTLTNDRYYKYYKLTFTSRSNKVRVSNMAITATYKVPAS